MCYLMTILLPYEIELSQQSRAHLVDRVFQKWSEPVSVLRFLAEIELWALATVSRGQFIDLIFHKWPEPVSFLYGIRFY